MIEGWVRGSVKEPTCGQRFQDGIEHECLGRIGLMCAVTDDEDATALQQGNRGLFS